MFKYIFLYMIFPFIATNTIVFIYLIIKNIYLKNKIIKICIGCLLEHHISLINGNSWFGFEECQSLKINKAEIKKVILYNDKDNCKTYGLLPKRNINRIKIWATTAKNKNCRTIVGNCKKINMFYNSIEIHIDYKNAWGKEKYGKIIMEDTKETKDFIFELYRQSVIGEE